VASARAALCIRYPESMSTKRVTVSLPEEIAAEAEAAVEAGDAKSVSAYVAGALQAQQARRQAFAALEKLYGGRPSAEALAEARRVLGLPPRALAS
jgi:antitoxin ParD1/3/4